MPIFKFPYTDFQQKNLDWIIDTVNDDKERTDQAMDDIAEAISNAETATENANTATENTNTAISNAETATTNANNAKDAANTAAANAQAAADKWATPYASNTVAGMTDHAKIYVYTGSETGYVAGNWYYWNGSAWTSGGVYVGDISDAVLFSTAQSKTDAEKAQARENIGTVSEEFVMPIFKDVFDLPMIATQSGYITTSGTESSSTTYKRSDYIPVKTGEKFKYKLWGTNGVSIISFFTSKVDSSYQSGYSVIGNSTLQDGEYTVSADGYIRVVCHHEFIDNGSAWFFTSNQIRDLEAKDASDIATLSSNVTSLSNSMDYVTPLAENTNKNVFSLMNQLTSNGYLNNYGELVSNASYRCTDYIPIKSGKTIKYNIMHAATLPIICFYTSKAESSCVTADNVLGVNGYKAGTFTASADGYVRFCYYYTSTESSAIFTDIIPDNVLDYYRENPIRNLNVLFLGDSIFGNDGEIVADLAKWVKTTINGAFGGTRVTDRGGSDNFQYFDGVNLVEALVTNTWTDQDAAASALEGSYPWITGRLAGLKTVDLSDIDVIIMNWGTNDYTGGETIANIKSAYDTVFELIQQYYPTIRILVTTPVWRYFGSISDNENGDNKVFNVSTLKEIAEAIEDNCKDQRISVLNAYQNMPLTYKTASTYFDSGDSTHLNATGNMVYAHLLRGKLETLF